jgi:hypothetical protein
MENTEENCEKIWEIWKKGKLKSEMIWKIWKISVLVIITPKEKMIIGRERPREVVVVANFR